MAVGRQGGGGTAESVATRQAIWALERVVGMIAQDAPTRNCGLTIIYSCSYAKLNEKYAWYMQISNI